MTLALIPLALVLLGAPRDSLEVQVLEPSGTLAADVRVEAHVGLTRYTLAPDFDRYISIQKFEGRTDEAGKVTFEDVPGGSRVTVFARGDWMAGMVDWEGGPCEIVLQPTGTVRGKVSAKKVQVRNYKLEIVGARGLDTREFELDSKGNYEVEDVVAGEVELFVKLGGWVAGRGAAEVKPDKKTKAPTLKITDEFETGADPMVDVARVLLVDEAGEPMDGTSVTWVGPQMFGRMQADAEGEVLLAGGNVMIGPPPFVLRLGYIGVDQEQRYLGRLVEVKRGTATVEVVARLQLLRIAVRRDGERERSFKLFAVTGDDPPRVWQGRLVDGAYELHLPPGPVDLFLGTSDGELHEAQYTLETSAEATDHTVELDQREIR